MLGIIIQGNVFNIRKYVGYLFKVKGGERVGKINNSNLLQPCTKKIDAMHFFNIKSVVMNKLLQS